MFHVSVWQISIPIMCAIIMQISDELERLGQSLGLKSVTNSKLYVNSIDQNIVQVCDIHASEVQLDNRTME